MMTMNTALVGLGGLVLAAASALGLAAAGTKRADCPGKITCVATGELICRDQCPEVDRDRADCPGLIECPLTGELICADKCPASGAASRTDAIPACCREE
jgi:hypothetical protein